MHIEYSFRSSGFKCLQYQSITITAVIAHLHKHIIVELWHQMKLVTLLNIQIFGPNKLTIIITRYANISYENSSQISIVLKIEHQIHSVMNTFDLNILMSCVQHRNMEYEIHRARSTYVAQNSALGRKSGREKKRSIYFLYGWHTCKLSMRGKYAQFNWWYAFLWTLTYRFVSDFYAMLSFHENAFISWLQ